MNISHNIYRTNRMINAFKITERHASKIAVGDRRTMTKIFSLQDVENFANITGDNNPIHLDKNYATSSGNFKGPIVHGAMLIGLVSALLGTKLPGHGSVIMSQHVKFPAPLYVGNKVKAEVRIVNIKRKYVECYVECSNIDDDCIKVLTGRTLLMLMKPTDT